MFGLLLSGRLRQVLLYILSYRDDLENLSPDTRALEQSDQSGKFIGVVVTLKGSEENKCLDRSGRVFDFVSRYFVPWVGIPEDPVTGKTLSLSLCVRACVRMCVCVCVLMLIGMKAIII